MDDYIHRTEPFNPGNNAFVGTFKTAAEFLDFEHREDRVRLRIGGMLHDDNVAINFYDAGNETNEAFLQSRFERHFGPPALNHFVASLGRREDIVSYKRSTSVASSGQAFLVMNWTGVPPSVFSVKSSLSILLWRQSGSGRTSQRNICGCSQLQSQRRLIELVSGTLSSRLMIVPHRSAMIPHT
jgi:hypothetical protein